MPPPSELFILDPAVKTPGVSIISLVSDLFKQVHSVASQPSPSISYHLPCILGMDSVYAREKQVSIGGILILGSSSHVSQHLPWQKELQTWLEKKVASAIPTLGICFGHQLIGHMFGAVVDKYKPGVKLSGFRKVQIIAEPRLHMPNQEGELMVSHEEVVKQLPRDFQLLAHSSEVEIDAFSHKNLPIWGWQAHIEADELFCKDMDLPANYSPKLKFGHSLLKHFLQSLPR